MKRTEIAFLSLVVVFLAAVALAADRIPPRERPDREIGSGAFTSAGWYCLTPPGETGAGTVSTANVGSDPVRIRVSTIGEGRRSDLAESELPPVRRSVSKLDTFGIGSAAGVIEAFGAATVADVFAPSTGSGIASARCTVQPAGRWFIPALSTSRGQDHYLLVANPFEEEAVMKVRMIAPDRDLVPARLKDLVIPASTQLAVSLAEYIPETATFGLDVTATQGRVVVGAFSRFASKDGQKGTSLVLGARESSTTWYFASGSVPTDGEEYLTVINPGDKEALMQFIFHEDAAQSAPEALQEVAVPAGRQVVIKVSDHVARGIFAGASITSINDVPVVAERVWLGAKAFEASIGVTSSSRRWALALGASVPGNETMVLVNPNRVPATVTISLITERESLKPDQLQAIVVEPGRRVVIDLVPILQGAAATAVVEAITGEVVVERRYFVGSPFSDFTETFGHPLE